MRPLLPITGTVLLSFLLGFGFMRWLTAMPARKQSPLAPSPAAKQMLELSLPATAASSADRIESTLEMAEKLESNEQEYEFYKALLKLDARELAACADQFAKLIRPDEFGEFAPLCEVWLDRWLEVDSAGALRWLEASSFLEGLYIPQNGPSLRSVLDGAQASAFKVLARRQPDWTRQYVEKIKPGARRDVAVFQLISEAARTDATRAKLLFESFVNDENRAAAIQGYVSGLAISDVRAAFDTAFSEAPGPLRNELLESTFGEASKRGLGTVAELMNRIAEPELRRDMVSEAALELSWNSREDLLPWLMEEAKRQVPPDKESGGFDSWSNQVAQALMTDNRDPEAAVDWAASIENDPERKLFSRLLSNWSDSDPEATRRWLSGHSTALEGKDELSSIISEMARNEPSATWAWAESLPPGSLRDQARFQAILGSGSGRTFAEAIAAYQAVGGSDIKGDLAKQMATVVTKLDPAGAAQWALQMEIGNARSAAIATVTQQWSQNDPRAVANWIQTLPGGSDRDSVIGEFAANVVYADPAMAKEWVLEVEDPNIRAKAAKEVFQIWSREDPAAPRAWLRSLPGVDEAWRAKFLQKAR